MAKQYLMPYTNLHELNLDWLINAMKQLEASWEGAEMNVTATASATAGTPTVKVSGSLKDTLNFDFELPQGNAFPSDTNPKADKGEGDKGKEPTFARGDHVHPSDSTKLDKVVSNETQIYATSNNTQVMLPDGYFAKTTQLETKQDALVSGSNIKTISGNSILGEGNLNIFDLIYPVDTIYLTYSSSFFPADVFGGTWNLIATTIDVGGTVVGNGKTLAMTNSSLIGALGSHNEKVIMYDTGSGQPISTGGGISWAINNGTNNVIGVATSAELLAAGMEPTDSGLTTDTIPCYVWRRIS